MLKPISTSLLWRGILAIAIGLVSVAWPNVTLGAFVFMFAAYSFMVAAADAVRAFHGRKAGSVIGYLALSLLSVTAGVVALAWPGMTALVLTLWVAGWAIAAGAIEATLAFRRGEATPGERALSALGGFITMAFGVVLAIRPDAGAVSLATVFGLFSIVSGVNALVLSAQLRRSHAAADRWVDAAAPDLAKAGHDHWAR